MRIRIYETDFEGNPVDCTGEFLQGATALAIVEKMQMNPFTASLKPLDFMQQTLNKISENEVILPNDEEQGASIFLQKLATLGFANFEIDEDELDIDNPTAYFEDNSSKK